jgi:hypothetical protein
LWQQLELILNQCLITCLNLLGDVFPIALVAGRYLSQCLEQLIFSSRNDFYGLGKGWHIIFVIFFTPAHNGTNPVNQLVANRVQD